MLKLNLLALAVASVLLSGAGTARADDAGTSANVQKSTPATPDGGPSDAQDQPARPDGGKDDNTLMEGIVVTGYRHSIETAIETKQNNTSIVESVSAEDIGKLPDISIAAFPHSASRDARRSSACAACRLISRPRC